MKNPPASLRFISLLMLLMIFSLRGIAQFEHKLFSSNMMVEGRIHYGFIYAQHLELEMFNSHFPAFELSITKITYGKHKWERDYNYPLIGATLFYSGLGNNPALGQAYALMPFINFPLYKYKSLTIGFRFALGLGYLTKPFDRITNYKNLAIGSHLNAAANLMFELRYRLNYYLSMSAGVCLQHFSNGSLKLPNYGINAPMVNLGISYRPFKENQDIGDRYIAPTEPYSAIVRHTIEFDFGVLVGYKNMKAVFGQNFMVYHIFENTFIPIGKISKVGIGLDFSYDPSQLKILEMHDIQVDNKIKIVRPGINAAYQLVMSRLGFIFNIGSYLGGMEKSNGPLYEKLAVQYNFSTNFFATVMLKVHWGRADYIGWGLGYKFDKKYGKKTIR
ncbi:MAG: acyloxyacyl hydrolase [Bacteroidales bacterium]|nr:acyloxyacyl hydrolase [Bacteroidales bacterium]